MRNGKLFLIIGAILLIAGLCHALLIEDQIRLARQTNAPDSVLARLYYEGYRERLASDPIGAINDLKTAARHYEEAENESQKYNVFGLIGQTYHRLGMYQLALEYLLQSFNYFSNQPESSAVAWLYSDIGNVYFALGQYDIAEPYYWDGLRLMKKYAEPYGQTVLYNNIALCKAKKGSYQQALDYLLKALSIRQELGNHFIIQHSYTLIAETYLQMGSLDTALNYYKRVYHALETPANEPHQSLLLRAQTALAIHDIYHILDDLTQAETYLLAAIEMLRSSENEYDLNRALWIRASEYLEQGRYTEAEPFLLEMHASASKGNFFDQAQQSSFALAKVYLELGKRDLARDFLDLHHAYTDSLINTRYTNDLVQLHSIVQGHIKDVENKNLKTQRRQIFIALVLISLLTLAVIFLALRSRYANSKHISRLRQLANASFESVIIHDKGRIVDLNESFTELVHLPRETCLGSLLADYAKEDECRQVLSAALKSGKDSHLECRFVDSNGGLRDVEIRSSAFRYLHRDLAVSVIRDVTDTNRYIASIIEQQQALTELVATKDRIFSIIGHDLKNPFNSIIGFSELISKDFEGFSNEELKNMNSMIHRSALAAHNLLENLLNWARIQTGRIHCSPKQIPLLKHIHDLSTLLHTQLSAKQIKLDVQCPGDLMVYADPDLLDIILRNIITNAIKFSHPSSSISIRTILTDKLQISVSDTGIGMSEEQLKHLFKLPDEASRGTSGEEGTGLGLILCRDMIRLQGGSIEVFSEEGRGSTFTLNFPLHL